MLVMLDILKRGVNTVNASKTGKLAERMVVVGRRTDVHWDTGHILLSDNQPMVRGQPDHQ